MKVLTNHFLLKMIVIISDYFSSMMIAILFTFSELFNFKKKTVERKLISLLKNLFLINLSASYFLILSIISVIQISAFSKTLLSNFLKFLSLILTFSDFFDAVLISLLAFFVSQNMCLCCSKQLIKDSDICCFHLNEYQKCFCCESNKT